MGLPTAKTIHQSTGQGEAPITGAPSLLLNAKAAAALIDVSESTFWKFHAQGRTPLPLRLGGSVVRWRREELEAWVRAGCPPRHQWKYSP
ncbi:MAG: AlpA family phage regulatory protein [Planctomycetes bacterium]|nr:AlpA family phage regulatory protein [Planctomycetota bacterium]